jgi:uncharacterized protein (TIGR03086 family)
MADLAAAYTVSDGLALLERAVGYTLGSLVLVTPDMMRQPTPCDEWDLAALLAHMDDSLAALQEAVESGDISLAPAPAPPQHGTDPVSLLRDRACRMLGSWANADFPPPTFIGGYAVPTGVVMSTGAVEITAHGWDVAQACGQPRPIPAALAADLLPCARLLVAPEDRPARFASRVALQDSAGPSELLLAFLGRQGPA